MPAKTSQPCFCLCFGFSQITMTRPLRLMISMGTWKVRVLDNDWTIVTRDGSLASHYEHTVLVTDGEPEVLSFPGAKVSEAVR